jgi:branched-subunit amino acid transport protein
MDWGFIFDLMYELSYAIAVFLLFLGVAMFRGRQTIINVIVGMYIGLLLSLQFPYTSRTISMLGSSTGEVIGQLLLFSGFTVLATVVIAKIMPEEYREKSYESFHKKLLVALVATILVIIYSYHVLPVTEILNPGTPLQSLFASDRYFFWWLLIPLIALPFL